MYKGWMIILHKFVIWNCNAVYTHHLSRIYRKRIFWRESQASFCLFLYFAQCKDKYSTNISLDGVLGTRTLGGRMEVAGKSTELLTAPLTIGKEVCLVHCLFVPQCTAPDAGHCRFTASLNEPLHVKTFCSIFLIVLGSSQRDQIERFLKVLDNHFFNKSSPDIWKLFGHFKKHHF